MPPLFLCFQPYEALTPVELFILTSLFHGVISKTNTVHLSLQPDNPEFDHDFLVTMGALHKKELLSEKDQFFPGDYRKKKTEVEKDETMTIRDYQQHIIYDRQGKLDEDVDGGKLFLCTFYIMI